MTQTSYLVAEHSNNYANPPHDCGPYSSLQWRIRERAKEVGDLYNGSTAAGPYYNYLNNLEVTTAGGNIDIDTGACFVDGNILTNSTSVTISPTHPGAPATYTVVAVLNDINATYNTNLDFPTDLTDYNAVASIPEYSCRLAIYKGAPAGLTQTTTVFMVPLATFDITAAGVVSNLTQDTTVRTWVNAELKTHFIHCTFGYNTTDGTNIYSTTANNVVLPDTKDSRGYAWFNVWEDFISDMTVKAVYNYSAVGAGNDLYGDTLAYYGACGEAPANHTDSLGIAAVTGVGGTNNCRFELSLSNASIGDIVRVEFRRDATNIADDLDRDVQLYGFNVEYFGYRR